MRPEPARCPAEATRVEGRFKLFGVEIHLDGEEHEEDACAVAAGMTAMEEEIMRKSWSMGNLTTCEVAGTKETAGNAGDQGYLSDEGPDQSKGKKRGARGQERKRGVPWSEEEHRTFLRGLEKLGKGDWRGIAKNFVTTRTPTQVASHAQKYFLRQTNPNKKKRRSSLFDVVINDSASVSSKASSLSLNESNVDMVPDADNPQKDVEVEAQVMSSTHEVSGSLESHPSVPFLAIRPDVSELRKTSLTAGAPGAMKNLVAYVERRNSQTLSLNPMVNGPKSNWVAGKVPSYTLNSETCPSDLFMLSAKEYPRLHPLFPDQAATTPVPQINDLELRIAPPQPHVLTKLSSPNASGAIRVV